MSTSLLFPDNFLLNRQKVNNHEGFRASVYENFMIFPVNFPVSRELGGKRCYRGTGSTNMPSSSRNPLFNDNIVLYFDKFTVPPVQLTGLTHLGFLQKEVVL